MTAHAAWSGWGVLSGLFWAAFWILVVLLLLRVVRGRPEGGRAPGASTAVQLLEERYARGEIGREEFLERRAVLTGAPPPAGGAPPAGGP